MPAIVLACALNLSMPATVLARARVRWVGVLGKHHCVEIHRAPMYAGTIRVLDSGWVVGMLSLSLSPFWMAEFDSRVYLRLFTL